MTTLFILIRLCIVRKFKTVTTVYAKKSMFIFDLIRTVFGMVNLSVSFFLFDAHKLFLHASMFHMALCAGVVLLYLQIVFWGAIMPFYIIYMYKKKEFPQGAFFMCMSDNLATFCGALALKIAMEHG